MSEERGDIKTRFQVGNQAWKARTKHGRDKLFSNPDVIWDAACEYFQWVEDNPLWEVKSYMYQGAPVQDQIPKMRAMTIGGLCVFLDITQETWKQYRINPDYSEIVSKIETIIREQKLTGAAADMLNANIIAREIGLKDQIDHSSTDGSMTPPKAITWEVQPIMPVNEKNAKG